MNTCKLCEICKKCITHKYCSETNNSIMGNIRIPPKECIEYNRQETLGPMSILFDPHYEHL